MRTENCGADESCVSIRSDRLKYYCIGCGKSWCMHHATMPLNKTWREKVFGIKSVPYGHPCPNCRYWPMTMVKFE